MVIRGCMQIELRELLPVLVVFGTDRFYPRPQTYSSEELCCGAAQDFLASGKLRLLNSEFPKERTSSGLRSGNWRGALPKQGQRHALRLSRRRLCRLVNYSGGNNGTGCKLEGGCHFCRIRLRHRDAARHGLADAGSVCINSTDQKLRVPQLFYCWAVPGAAASPVCSPCGSPAIFAARPLNQPF